MQKSRQALLQVDISPNQRPKGGLLLCNAQRWPMQHLLLLVVQCKRCKNRRKGLEG